MGQEAPFRVLLSTRTSIQMVMIPNKSERLKMSPPTYRSIVNSRAKRIKKVTYDSEIHLRSLE